MFSNYEEALNRRSESVDTALRKRAKKHGNKRKRSKATSVFDDELARIAEVYPRENPLMVFERPKQFAEYHRDLFGDGDDENHGHSTLLTIYVKPCQLIRYAGTEYLKSVQSEELFGMSTVESLQDSASSASRRCEKIDREMRNLNVDCGEQAQLLCDAELKLDVDCVQRYTLLYAGLLAFPDDRSLNMLQESRATSAHMDGDGSAQLQRHGVGLHAMPSDQLEDESLMSVVPPLQALLPDPDHLQRERTFGVYHALSVEQIGWRYGDQMQIDDKGTVRTWAWCVSLWDVPQAGDPIKMSASQFWVTSGGPVSSANVPEVVFPLRVPFREGKRGYPNYVLVFEMFADWQPDVMTGTLVPRRRRFQMPDAMNEHCRLHGFVRPIGFGMCRVQRPKKRHQAGLQRTLDIFACTDKLRAEIDTFLGRLRPKTKSGERFFERRIGAISIRIRLNVDPIQSCRRSPAMSTSAASSSPSSSQAALPSPSTLAAPPPASKHRRSRSADLSSEPLDDSATLSASDAMASEDELSRRNSSSSSAAMPSKVARVHEPRNPRFVHSFWQRHLADYDIDQVTRQANSFPQPNPWLSYVNDLYVSLGTLKNCSAALTCASVELLSVDDAVFELVPDRLAAPPNEKAARHRIFFGPLYENDPKRTASLCLSEHRLSLPHDTAKRALLAGGARPYEVRIRVCVQPRAKKARFDEYIFALPLDRAHFLDIVAGREICLHCAQPASSGLVLSVHPTLVSSITPPLETLAIFAGQRGRTDEAASSYRQALAVAAQVSSAGVYHRAVLYNYFPHLVELILQQLVAADDAGEQQQQIFDTLLVATLNLLSVPPSRAMSRTNFVGVVDKLRMQHLLVYIDSLFDGKSTCPRRLCNALVDCWLRSELAVAAAEKCASVSSLTSSSSPLSSPSSSPLQSVNDDSDDSDDSDSVCASAGRQSTATTTTDHCALSRAPNVFTYRFFFKLIFQSAVFASLQEQEQSPAPAKKSRQASSSSSRSPASASSSSSPRDGAHRKLPSYKRYSSGNLQLNDASAGVKPHRLERAANEGFYAQLDELLRIIWAHSCDQVVRWTDPMLSEAVLSQYVSRAFGSFLRNMLDVLDRGFVFGALHWFIVGSAESITSDHVTAILLMRHLRIPLLGQVLAHPHMAALNLPPKNQSQQQQNDDDNSKEGQPESGGSEAQRLRRRAVSHAVFPTALNPLHVEAVNVATAAAAKAPTVDAKAAMSHFFADCSIFLFERMVAMVRRARMLCAPSTDADADADEESADGGALCRRGSSNGSGNSLAMAPTCDASASVLQDLSVASALLFDSLLQLEQCSRAASRRATPEARAAQLSRLCSMYFELAPYLASRWQALGSLCSAANHRMLMLCWLQVVGRTERTKFCRWLQRESISHADVLRMLAACARASWTDAMPTLSSRVTARRLVANEARIIVLRALATMFDSVDATPLWIDRHFSLLVELALCLVATRRSLCSARSDTSSSGAARRSRGNSLLADERSGSSTTLLSGAEPLSVGPALAYLGWPLFARILNLVCGVASSVTSPLDASLAGVTTRSKNSDGADDDDSRNGNGRLFARADLLSRVCSALVVHLVGPHAAFRARANEALRFLTRCALRCAGGKAHVDALAAHIRVAVASEELLRDCDLDRVCRSMRRLHHDARKPGAPVHAGNGAEMAPFGALDWERIVSPALRSCLAMANMHRSISLSARQDPARRIDLLVEQLRASVNLPAECIATLRRIVDVLDGADQSATYSARAVELAATRSSEQPKRFAVEVAQCRLAIAYCEFLLARARRSPVAALGALSADSFRVLSPTPASLSLPASAALDVSASIAPPAGAADDALALALKQAIGAMAHADQSSESLTAIGLHLMQSLLTCFRCSGDFGRMLKWSDRFERLLSAVAESPLTAPVYFLVQMWGNFGDFEEPCAQFVYKRGPAPDGRQRRMQAHLTQIFRRKYGFAETLTLFEYSDADRHFAALNRDDASSPAAASSPGAPLLSASIAAGSSASPSGQHAAARPFHNISLAMPPLHPSVANARGSSSRHRRQGSTSKAPPSSSLRHRRTRSAGTAFHVADMQHVEQLAVLEDANSQRRKSANAKRKSVERRRGEDVIIVVNDDDDDDDDDDNDKSGAASYASGRLIFVRALPTPQHVAAMAHDAKNMYIFCEKVAPVPPADDAQDAPAALAAWQRATDTFVLDTIAPELKGIRRVRVRTLHPFPYVHFRVPVAELADTFVPRIVHIDERIRQLADNALAALSLRLDSANYAPSIHRAIMAAMPDVADNPLDVARQYIGSSHAKAKASSAADVSSPSTRRQGKQSRLTQRDRLCGTIAELLVTLSICADVIRSHIDASLRANLEAMIEQFRTTYWPAQRLGSFEQFQSDMVRRQSIADALLRRCCN
jgi:hypothetical protein